MQSFKKPFSSVVALRNLFHGFAQPPKKPWLRTHLRNHFSMEN